MPRILIPLRPILGVLQIGIKSQGYREPESRYLFKRVTITRLRTAFVEPEAGLPPSPIYVPFVQKPVYTSSYRLTMRYYAEEQPMPAADYLIIRTPGYIPEVTTSEEDLEAYDEGGS
ncbi:hypothetical protein Tco_0878245 [Tanacetum coccineum]|uniref:Uncharacterized protein n=1 Tax=Tanacetum coccineum TaxID=301880 RepID=A0ABQ5C387_9ASTR